MRKHPHLFEIAAWPWLERLSREQGRLVTLADVREECWDDLARLGFDCVFLMGVWRRSTIGREIARTDRGLVAAYDRVLPGWTDADVVGSPYCIQGYEPDDRMGGWQGLDALHRQLRDRGIALLLDFVPNHTAFDHPWIATHPERYVLGTRDDYERAPGEFRQTITAKGESNYIACARDPYFPPWTDVAQLNYFNINTREAMIDTLRSIAAHCDGVRCDMAMLVFNDVFDRTWRWLLGDRWSIPASEFWTDATRSVRELIYLAEVYWDLEGRALEQGFDFAYDKRLLDALHSPFPAQPVRAVLTAEHPDASKLARFLENHDEPRSAATLASSLPACASLLGSVPGMRFFYDGQLSGARDRAPVQLGRWPDEPVDTAIRELYERVLRFATHAALHEGAWRMLNVSPASDGTWQNVVAYRWRSEDALAVITVNLGTSASQAHVDVTGDLGPGTTHGFEDALTGATYNWSRTSLDEHGLWVRLDAGKAHLFFVRPSE
jgi:alpha amylase-like protein